MFAWIMENLGTIIVSAALVLAVAAVIVNMARNKKKGKSSCGCGCAGCPAGGICGGNSTGRPRTQEDGRAR